MIRVHWATALAVLAVAVSGCSGSGDKPLTHAQLEARLLTASTVPAGARVNKLDDSDPSTPRPPDGLDCESLISLAFSFFDNKSVRPVSVASVMIDSRPVDGGDLWLGNEFLLSYRGDDAHNALADGRSLVGFILIVITATTPLPEGSLMPTDSLIKAAHDRFTST